MVLRSKVFDAQTLARTILGRDTTQLSSADLLDAIQTFSAMNEELAQLQRESQLTQQALVATQCSQTCISKRLDKIAESKEEDLSVASQDSPGKERFPALLPEQVADLEEGDCNDGDEEDSQLDIPHPEDNLEEEIMMIVPTKSKSLGVGLLGDMEQCIVEWQMTFEQLNEQHESQIHACQTDLERLHVRIDTMKALNPTGVEAAEAAQRARDQLEKLVEIVEAFPSKAKVEALQRELEASRRAEQDSHEALARAMEELQAVREREEDLLRRLEEAESFARQSSETHVAAPKTRTAPARLLRYTKKKLQRLFRLDRSVRQSQSRVVSTEVASEQVLSSAFVSSTNSSTSEDAHLEFISDSGMSSKSETPQASEPDLDLLNVGSSDDDPLLVFSASDHDSSDEEDEVDRFRGLEHLSFSDGLDTINRDDVMSACAGNLSSTKLSPSSSMDECEMDDTSLSFATDATTNSSSGTPPSKLVMKKKREFFVEPESRGIFAMAKSLLWSQ